MEKIGWSDHVRNEQVLRRVNARGIFYYLSKERRLPGLVTFWVGELPSKHVIEGKIEGMIVVTGR